MSDKKELITANNNIDDFDSPLPPPPPIDTVNSTLKEDENNGDEKNDEKGSKTNDKNINENKVLVANPSTTDPGRPKIPLFKQYFEQYLGQYSKLTSLTQDSKWTPLILVIIVTIFAIFYSIL